MNIRNNRTKNTNNINRISLYAPNEPRNDMNDTITPAAINNDADVIYRFDPNKRSINERSANVHTPIANTTRPPT